MTLTTDKPTILLITNEPSRMSPIVSVLEAADFTVIVATGTAGALVTWRRTQPDIIISDLKASSLERFSCPLSERGGASMILIGEDDVTQALQYEAITKGAFDYIQITEDPSLLLARTKQLASLKQTMNRLHHEATTDIMTGLTNRRAFRLAIGNEVERWRRYQIPCSLFAVDIDHMKLINDEHGHIMGDEAINHVARALIEASDNKDTATRLGGEEYALLLAGADEEKAKNVAKHLHELISSEPVPVIGRMTVSIGVATCPTHGQSEKAIYLASDTALYQAKAEGRDRTVIALPIDAATE